MDSMHDLGGKEGMGPVDVDAPPFRHGWEERQWALSKTVPIEGFTIDANRYCLEQLPGPAYLSMPYFEKWCLRDLALLVISGTFTVEEVLAGATATRNAPPPALDIEGAKARLRANEACFEVESSAPPAFAEGDRVATIRAGHSGHTRLPAYARAATGRIHAHRGVHVYPDDSADGNERGEHLYTVSFRAADLWPDADRRDTVLIDLWEPYLSAA